MTVRVAITSTGPAEWNKKPVAIVGGGPSLRGFDLERLRSRFIVLAVNGAIFDIPWADAGFSLDRRAMRVWWPQLLASPMPLYFAVPNETLVNFDTPPNPNMTFIQRVHGAEFHAGHRLISCGGSSGYGALQLAFKKGARKIILFGFDYGQTPTGEDHHNQQHYTRFVKTPASKWADFALAFHSAVPVLQRASATVINASPHSAIDCFPRITPDEAIS